MGIQDNGPNQAKDKCNGCKYFHNNPAYRKCPGCDNVFENNLPTFVEFAEMVSKIRYVSDKIAYDSKLNDPAYSKFIIYTALVKDMDNKEQHIWSADMTKDYGIPPHIVKYAFTLSDKKIGSCSVMVVLCPHINHPRSYCYTPKDESYREHMLCPAEVFARTFSTSAINKLIEQMAPIAAPSVKQAVESVKLTAADAQIRKNVIEYDNYNECNKNGVFINPNNEKLYVMPRFLDKYSDCRAAFDDFNEKSDCMVFSIRMIQKYVPSLIDIGLDKLFMEHKPNIYVPICRNCGCVHHGRGRNFMCPAAVIRDELMKAAHKIRDDAFKK